MITSSSTIPTLTLDIVAWLDRQHTNINNTIPPANLLLYFLSRGKVEEGNGEVLCRTVVGEVSADLFGEAPDQYHSECRGAAEVKVFLQARTVVLVAEEVGVPLLPE